MSSNIARLQHNAISSFPLLPSHLLTLHNMLGVCHISYDISKANMTFSNFMNSTFSQAYDLIIMWYCVVWWNKWFRLRFRDTDVICLTQRMSLTL